MCPGDASGLEARRLRAVDWCCGDGGMTRGMLSAGFEVWGLDVVRRPRYPPEARHVQHDIRTVTEGVIPLADWDHFSPPCARFSNVRGSRGVDPPTDADLDLLRACIRLRDSRQARFWSIENVCGAVPWFTPLLGPPKLLHGPYVIWGNFPPFLVARTGLRKGINPNHAASHRAWTRAFMPMALVGPMARAIADAL